MGSRSATNEFDILRRKAKQRTTAESQTAGESIQRRFAAMGNLQSGAAIKQEELAREAVKRRGEETLGSIDIAQQQEMQRRKEIEDTRAFASKEALAGRQFTSEQAGLQRGFQAGESALGRKFAGEEGAAGRAATAALQVGQIKSQEKIASDSLAVALKGQGLQQQQIDNALSLGLKGIGISEQQLALAKEQGLDQLQLGRDQMAQALELGLKSQGMQQQQIDMAKEQFNKEFDENIKTNTINSIIAFSNTEMNQDSFDQVTSLLGQLDPTFLKMLNKGQGPRHEASGITSVKDFSFGRKNEFGQFVDSDGDVL